MREKILQSCPLPSASRNLKNRKNPLFRLVLKDVNVCLNLIAPVAHDWVFGKVRHNFSSPLKMLLGFSVGCQNYLGVASSTVLLELLLPCPDILHVLKKHQFSLLSNHPSWVLVYVRWTWISRQSLIFHHHSSPDTSPDQFASHSPNILIVT